MLPGRTIARREFCGECLEGPPTVVIEIRSPDDETLEKLPFYAKLGVPEVWVIDRDSRAVEIEPTRYIGYNSLVST